MSVPARNPKDSMKSTWRSDKTQWGPFHHIYDLLDIHSSYPNDPPPVHAKTDKVPHTPEWMLHRQALVHACLPMIIHQAYCYFTHKNLSWGAALAIYMISFKASGIHQIQQLRRMGQIYGYFDGDAHKRDEVPDHSVAKVFFSLSNTSVFRSLFTVFLSYDRSKTPMQMNWMLMPLEVGLYGIVLDFWFYWYHRVMHEYDSLWKYHRTHHLTKHPNPLLTLYADTIQEIFDILGIPLLTYGTLKLVGLPMAFYEWWICHQYIMFTEVSGHSGLRIYTNPPSPFGWLLRMFDCELTIEDHDLHHRKGWKTSGNYGKQTRLWDRIFGTVLPRIEATRDNIDYENPAIIPII